MFFRQRFVLEGFFLPCVIFYICLFIFIPLVFCSTICYYELVLDQSLTDITFATGSIKKDCNLSGHKFQQQCHFSKRHPKTPLKISNSWGGGGGGFNVIIKTLYFCLLLDLLGTLAYRQLFVNTV